MPVLNLPIRVRISRSTLGLGLRQPRGIFVQIKERGAVDILVVLGGTIPSHDIAALKALGVAEVFGPGTTLDSTVAFIRSRVKPRSLPLS